MTHVLPIPPVSDVAHIIQLVLAPVFLLTGVGAFLNVCTSRLARIVDRSRAISPLILAGRGEEHDRLLDELRVLDRRMVIVDTAILLSIISAGLVCLVVVLLFAAQVVGRPLDTVIALFFIASMLCQAAAFASFIVEIRLSARTIRINDDLLFHKEQEDGNP